MYQKIEQMIGQKLEAFPAQEDEVLLLMERVAEAQRFAVMDMRSKEGKRGKRGHERAEDAAEDATAGPELQRMIDQAGRKKQKKRR